MWFIIGFLLFITLGSIVWTVVQIVKPSWFFVAENEANVKRIRPTWYLSGGVLGLISILLIWINALQLQLTSVWTFTAIITLGSVKPLGMVFFYEKFSGEASKLVIKMNDSKKTYWAVVIMRGILSIILVMVTLYFMGIFGEPR